MNIIFVYITNPTKKEAVKIAEHLLEKKLIGCANIFKAESLYRWQGKIAEESEYVLIAKTLNKNFERVKKEVEAIHSYSIPCIVKIPVKTNEKFYNWLRGETSNPILG